jgi:uncharacterized protein YcbK (DUF882 family)
MGAAIAGAAAPTLGWAEPLTDADMRSVSFSNLHTGESMEGVYWEQGEYVPDVLQAVNNLLRDHRTGDVYPIDPRLLDLLDAVSARTETKTRFEVISGYRSAKTNAMLHERSAEVAKKSLHTMGHLGAAFMQHRVGGCRSVAPAWRGGQPGSRRRRLLSPLGFRSSRCRPDANLVRDIRSAKAP